VRTFSSCGESEAPAYRCATNLGDTCENRAFGLPELETCPNDAVTYFGSSGQSESV